MDTHWGERALAYAKMISALAAGRGSATQAEARAAETVHKQLAGLGIQDIRLQHFQGLRSIWLFFALAFGLALAGHAAFWLLRSPLGVWGAWVVSLAFFGLSFTLHWRKFSFQDYPLRSSLPHGPSQNVLAIIPAQQAPQQRVVLIGHLDSHRAVWMFATDWLTRLFVWTPLLTIYGGLLAPLLYLLAALSGVPALAWLALPLALAHFVGWFTGVTADLGAYSPGANDNASAVGSLLALAERLQHQALQHTEVWLAFTGCEETGCDGMRALLAEHGSALRQATFIDFELVGIGDQLCYLQSEGVVRRRQIDPQLEQRLQAVAQAAQRPLHPLNSTFFGAFTEMGVVWENGLGGVCLLMRRAQVEALPEWHRLSDVAARLEPQALATVHAFTWEFLQDLERQAER